MSAQAHAGDVITAVRNRTKALEVARRTGDRAAVARAVSSLDAPVIWTIQPDRALDADLVGAIEESLPAEAGELRCRMLVALCHALEGHDPERIEAASAEALAIADALGDLRLRCMALNGRYWVCLTPDRRNDLETLGHDLLAASAAAGLLGYQTLGHFSLLMVALSRNDWTTARRHADMAMELSTSGQLGLALGILAFLDALHLLVRGEFERAESVYTQLGEQLARTGDANGAMVGTVGRFVVKLAAGRVHEAVEELAALWERLPEDVGELYTRALAGAGRLEEARAVWASARVPRRDYYWLVFMSLRADNAIALGHRAAAEECYRLLLPSDGELAGLHSGSVTLGPVAHTLGDLAVFLDRPGDAEAHYLRAAEVARQVGSPHWEEAARRALTRLRR
ncbi:hypothetical protein [Microbispora sp. GKU 823]|uniref:hypothetical protein n=1 Tax=Microbispora sp. GKU 823 TaxID=1652100 RepID=UPI002117F04E|nr:hypothetical protein [Microbispora sp. GKU 823]